MAATAGIATIGLVFSWHSRMRQHLLHPGSVHNSGNHRVASGPTPSSSYTPSSEASGGTRSVNLPLAAYCGALPIFSQASR